MGGGHSNHPSLISRFKPGFTLAETLITLSIIGVVAALTMPVMVNKYHKSVAETRITKFYSIMNNAIRMAEIDYGPQDTWTDYYENDEFDDDYNRLFEKGEKYDAHINKYFAPYLKIVGSEEIRNVGTPQKVYYLSDGTAFSFNLHENREINFFPFGNPKKCLASAKRSRCSFCFAFLPTGGLLEYKYNFSNGMQPALLMWDGKEENLPCLKKAQFNGWKFPDDCNPWK